MNQYEPAVSVVIPVLDPGPMLFDCLASIGLGDERVEAILFDNASSDGMVAKATELYAKLRVLRAETNLGFASGSNRGAEAARGRYLLFLNSDAVLPKNALRHLLYVAEADTAAAIWQPVILSPNGDVENAGAFFTWSGFLVRRSDAPAIDAQPYASFAGSGACLLVRRDVFESLGGFQDAYFAYIEDVDLCWRARLAGWEIRVVPGIRVHHEKNVTTKHIFAAHEVRYMNFRNRLRTIGANASASTLIRVLPVHVLACLATAVVLAASGRLKSAYAVLRAVVWPLTHGPEMLAQRRDARALRKHGDREVLREDLVVSFSIRDGWRLLRDHRVAWRGP